MNKNELEALRVGLKSLKYAKDALVWLRTRGEAGCPLSTQERAIRGCTSAITEMQKVFDSSMIDRQNSDVPPPHG